MCSKTGCQPKQKHHNRHAGTGRNTTKLRKQVAILFKPDNWYTAKRVVNLNRNVIRDTQEEYEIPLNAE